MAIDERSRHELFNALEQALGKEHASVLMEHLPPLGWADVATKRDLEHLEARIEAKIDASARELMSRMISMMILLNSVSVLTVAGLAFAAARIV
jgi:hypothetical protein